MEYTVIVNRRSYDLPKKTIAMTEKIDDVLRVDELNAPVKQKFDKLHSFVKDCIGAENAEEALGSANLSEIDLTELTLITRSIIDAYDKPISDYELKKQREKLEELPIEKITPLVKAAQSMANAQMMKK